MEERIKFERTVSRRRLALLYCFFFCLWAVPSSIQAKDSPIMVLKEQLIDFRDVIEGKDITHTFDVLNEGDEPLRIERVKPDCSCSVVHFDQIIPPSGQGKIIIRVNTKGYIGPERWGFKVFTNDPTWKEAILDVRANIKPLIRIDGQAIQFTGRNKVPIIKEVEISTETDRTLLLTPQEFTLRSKVTWSIKEIQKGKRYKVVFKSIPGKSDDYRGFLTLKTNFPEKPELDIWIIGKFTR